MDEYKKLVQQIRETSTGDLYNQLINKEERVLEIADRVLNRDTSQRETSQMTTQKPLEQFVRDIPGQIILTFQEIKDAQRPEQVWKILSQPSRLIHLGIAVFFIGIILIMLD